jgi:hypothetical protein
VKYAVLLCVFLSLWFNPQARSREVCVCPISFITLPRFFNNSVVNSISEISITSASSCLMPRSQ